MTHMEKLLTALYLSEGWYNSWLMGGKPHRRARAVVLFDRCLNGELR